MRLFFLSLLIFTALAGTTQVYAAALDEFTPLVPDLPQIDDARDITEYLNGLMAIAVGAAALLAVVMITIGGIEWMTTDSVPGIGNAKGRIQDAIVGLLIVLMSVLILNIINPEITNLNLFRSANPVAGGAVDIPIDIRPHEQRKMCFSDAACTCDATLSGRALVNSGPIHTGPPRWRICGYQR